MPPVFAGLDGCCNGGADGAVGGAVLGGHRFFDPCQIDACILEGADAADGVLCVEALVEVEHHCVVGTGDGAQGFERSQVFSKGREAQLDLESGEACAQGGFDQRLVPTWEKDALAVIGADRARGDAKEGADGLVEPLAACIPQGEVEPGEGHADHALTAEQAELVRGPAVHIAGQGGLPLERFGQRIEKSGQGPQQRWRVGKDIGRAGDVLVGLHIDDDERCGRDRRLRGGDRVRQRRHDRRRLDRGDAHQSL